MGTRGYQGIMVLAWILVLSYPPLTLTVQDVRIYKNLPEDSLYGLPYTGGKRHYHCTCDEGWRGELCDVPICKEGCSKRNGYCLDPSQCLCRLGWTGDNCGTCLPYPGCQNGNCRKPWECTCEPGWTGVFCNITAETTSITIPTITTPQPSDELVLTKNNLLKTLPTIGKEFVVSFDVYINKFGSSWQSVVHLTSTGREKGGSWGDRVPAVWISARKTFHICSALNGNGNTCFDGGSPNAGEWISVEISQTLTNGKFMYEIKINKQSVYRVENTRAQEFNNVKVFAGNSVYNSLDGKIRNLLIENVPPQLPTPQPPITRPPPQPPIIRPPPQPPIVSKALVLKKNNLLKTLPTIGKEFTVSFDVYINKFGPSWQNIIHLTSTGRDCCNWGDRVPAAWISSKKKFYICSAINGGGDTCYHGTVANAKEWISVQISQTLINPAGVIELPPRRHGKPPPPPPLNGKFVYEIKINGESVYKVDNNKAEVFEDVKVFAADNFYKSLDGKIRNFSIKNQSPLPEGCGPDEVSVVSGDKYSSEFPVRYILSRGLKDEYAKNYWLGINNRRSNFILNLGCQNAFDAIQLVNTHNNGHRDRSTRKFRLYVSNKDSGPWTKVLEKELVDSRQQPDPLPLQKIELDSGRTVAQFVKFELVSWWGSSGGLQYFDIGRSQENESKEMVLKKNNLVKTLPSIGKEFTVSFDVYINKFGPSWQNIIHLTSTSRDCCNWGDRVPAAWISSKKQFYICSAINGGGDTCYHGTVANAREWISVHISQTLNNGKFVYEIKINGKSVYKKDNNKAEEFKNVKVFAADNFYNSLDGKIRNLSIRNQTSLTLSSYKYEYLPWDGKTFHFKVKTQNDAHIMLAPAPDSDGNEIVIGGWGNQKSVVRRGKQGRSISNGLTQTNSILSSSEFRGFWIETYLDDNERVIKVGKEGESVPFMTGVDPDPLDINYVALSAWAGLSATYVF